MSFDPASLEMKPAVALHFLALAALAACVAPPGTPAVPESRDIVIVSTTDVHGRLRGWDYYAESAESGRGLTRAATIVDSGIG